MKKRSNLTGRKKAIILLLISLCVFAGCSNEGHKSDLSDPSQLNASGYSIGVPQGAAAMTLVEQKFPKSRIKYFQSPNDGYMAVKHGKIDAFAFDRHTLQYVSANNPDLAIFNEKIGDERIVIGTAKGKDDLIKKVNTFIKRYREDGTYQDMYNRWILGKGAKMPNLPETINPAITLKIGTDGVNEPMSFYANGKLTGFDIEFTGRLALFLNAKVIFQTMEFSALVIAAQSGKIDLLVASLNATPERGRNMLFSDTYIDSEISLLVRKDRLSARARDKIDGVAQFDGKKIGVQTGLTYESALKEKIPRTIPVYFTTFKDQIDAVRAGQIAGFLVDEMLAKNLIRQTSDITYVAESLSVTNYAYAFAGSQATLQGRVDAILREMKNDGTLKKLAEKWFGEDDTIKILPDIKPEGKKGVIRYATRSDIAPFAYTKNGRLVGYEVDAAMIIAERLGYRLETMIMEFSAIIPALMSGQADMAGGLIAVTPERSKSVLFSIPNYTGRTVIMAGGGAAGGTKGAGRDGFWSDLQRSFDRTFVVEDRYKLILHGLGITIFISLLSALFGTILGFGVCIMRRAKARLVNISAKVFIRAIQGTPIVVLLMILYYVVFGGMDINAVAVAVIGFSINFAAYVSEMMRTGIDAVDKGQQEAAQAIGFNRVHVFMKITFPQAARHVLPVFKGEFISMLKMTSVVGYIAIQDLTKMSDIIRSRTYEAFFPLIATALIYFVIAYVMAYLLSLVEMRVDPKQRKRIVRGV